MLEIRWRYDAHQILEGELFAGFISVMVLEIKVSPARDSRSENVELRGSA